MEYHNKIINKKQEIYNYVRGKMERPRRGGYAGRGRGRFQTQSKHEEYDEKVRRNLKLRELNCRRNHPTRIYSTKQRLENFSKVQENKRADYTREYQTLIFRDKLLGEYEYLMSSVVFPVDQENNYRYHWLDAITTVLQDKIEHNERMAYMLARERRNTFSKRDRRGNTILNSVIRITHDLTTTTLEQLFDVIEASRRHELQTSLSIPNNGGYTPVHYIIKSKKQEIILPILKRYHKELANDQYNHPHGKTNILSEQFVLNHPYPICNRIPTEKRNMRKSRWDRSTQYRLRRKYDANVLSGKYMLPIPGTQQSMNLLHMSLLYFSDQDVIYVLNDLGICKVPALINEPCQITGNYPLHVLMYTYVRTNQRKFKQDHLLELVKHFFSCGADVSVKNGYGYTPAAFLVYNYELFHCFVSQKSIFQMLKLLIELSGQDLLNDWIPSLEKSVFYIIFKNWTDDQEMLTWMIKEGFAMLTSQELSELLLLDPPVVGILKKYKALEECGMDTHVTREAFMRREILKEVAKQRKRKLLTREIQKEMTEKSKLKTMQQDLDALANEEEWNERLDQKYF
jgi:hypothetical protein